MIASIEVGMIMRTSNQAQVFTVFGGAFVAEAHDHIAPRKRAAAMGPLAAVLVALLVGTATTAGAIAATKHFQSTGYGWSYNAIQASGSADVLY
jgi:hypothetical protein